jgi:hypothetical protein
MRRTWSYVACSDPQPGCSCWRCRWLASACMPAPPKAGVPRNSWRRSFPPLSASPACANRVRPPPRRSPAPRPRARQERVRQSSPRPERVALPHVCPSSGPPETATVQGEQFPRQTHYDIHVTVSRWNKTAEALVHRTRSDSTCAETRAAFPRTGISGEQRFLSSQRRKGAVSWERASCYDGEHCRKAGVW